MNVLGDNFAILDEMVEKTAAVPEVRIWLIMLSATLTRQAQEQYELRRRLDELERQKPGAAQE